MGGIFGQPEDLTVDQKWSSLRNDFEALKSDFRQLTWRLGQLEVGLVALATRADGIEMKLGMETGDEKGLARPV